MRSPQMIVVACCFMVTGHLLVAPDACLCSESSSAVPVLAKNGKERGSATNSSHAPQMSTTPVAREDSWWLHRHRRFNGRAKQGDVDLIFIGDSITQGWEDAGKDIWQKFYGHRKAMNLGISGDRTQHVLWRLEHGNIDGIRPKLAVVMIGTNNSNDNENTAEEIALGIKAIVSKLRDKLPQTKILLLGIFPRNPRPDAQRTLLARASELASTVADDKMVHYLDIGGDFLESDGSLSPDVMPDFLHPGPKGYEIWAKAIEPYVLSVVGYPVSKHRQLFFDDFLIERRWGVERTVHPAEKHASPVLIADRPWERIATCPVVEYSPERKLFQMWYAVYPAQQGYICYAESADGVRWRKPEAGVVEFKGSMDNNIVMPRISQGWFLLDPAEKDPARRYKGLAEIGGTLNFRTMYSHDGIRWSNGELAKGLLVQDDSPGLFYDAISRQFVFVKRKLENEHRRMIQTAFSDDFVHWRTDPYVFAPDEDDAKRAAERGAQRMDFYGLRALPYEGFYLGLLDCFYLWRMPGPKTLHDGPIEVELVWSRDAVHWNRVAPGQPVIPRGQPGTFDGGMVLGRSALVHGDEIMVFYDAASCTHGCGSSSYGGPVIEDHVHEGEPGETRSIGLARWRLDRFVSLDADKAIRSVITKPLDFSGGSLTINADASHGSIWVEVQDAEGKPIEGYEAAQCEPLHSDEMAYTVKWSGRSELPKSRPLRLRFAMKDASLYSFSIR